MAATTVNRSMSQYSGDTPSDLFIRDVSKWPKLIQRSEYPLTAMIKHSEPLERKMNKVEWGRSYLDPVNDTITEAMIDEAGPSTVTPANIGYYMVGHKLQFASGEQGLVTAVGASTLTVSRGYAGTTTAAQADNSGLRIIGIAVKENAESPQGPITQGDIDYNYFQIFDEYVQFSHRARVTPTYEVKDDRLTHEIQKKLQNTFPHHLENTLLWSERYLGSTTVASSMGGVFSASFNTSTSDLNGAILTEYDFLEAVQLGFNQVGGSLVGKTVMAHPFYKRVFANWYNNIRQIGGDTKSITNSFDSLESDFGTFKWVHNHHMTNINNPALPDGRILIFDPDDFELIPYDSESKWGVWAIYEGGWYSRRAIRGYYSLRAMNPQKRIAITEASTTAADYPNFTS
jgi:hypothetical protein